MHLATSGTANISVGAAIYGSSGSPSATASVTLNNTAASLGAGDSETRPLNINVNYIIKI
jgi:hypothetical protein